MNSRAIGIVLAVSVAILGLTGVGEAKEKARVKTPVIDLPPPPALRPDVQPGHLPPAAKSGTGQLGRPAKK